MEEFDTRAWYKFTDKDGNTFSSLGDNGFVQQSIKEGVPISVNENGDWYIEPYLENKNGQVVAHLPEWFKSTNEYEQWKTYAAQIPSSLTDDTFNSLNDIFKGLSSQGLLRNSLKNDIASFGVTDANLQNKYVNDIVQVAVEGKGGGAAKLNDIYGSDQNESAADVARSFKDMSKEELSSIMTNLYETMKKGQSGTFTGTQKQMLDAVTVARILNYIDDNYSTFGTDNEFKGLLEMSGWQKFQRAGTEFMQTLAEGPLGLFTARLVYLGTNGSMKIENAREEIFSRPLVGGGLENGEGAQKIGSVAGSVGNIAVTMATSMLLGNAINAKLAVNSPSGFWGSVGNFAQTIPGGAVTDFFLHDIPVDLIFAADDLARTGSVEKAWYNPEEEQPLFGIPIIGSFGPRVPGGLAMNLAGDAIIDAAIPILAIAGNTAYKELDDITGGGVSRTKEKIAVKNLEIQNKLVEIPVLGTGWQKFMNYMMGSEKAQYIREARKAAIAEGSMEPYVRAQNMLTLKNHAGGEVVAPMYKKLDDELKVTESAKNFLKNAERYGGVGETRVEWKEIKNGVEQTLYKAVPDTLPRDVKQGLLDVERLSELKGEIENEGGILSNPARDLEIATIEKRLESTPQEIKDFANRFSELNKRVEALGIDLGVTTQEWIDALQLDPRWDKYMVRQALVPGNPNLTGTAAPTSAVLTKKRKGYYADNYISPDLALNMKVEALGRAYAWNEQAKSLVAFEVSQGKVIAGKGSVDIANRLAQVKQEIKMGDAYRKSIDYDTVLNNFHKDTSAVNDAFRKVNDLQNLPNKITLKAVYDNQQSSRVKELVNDFNSGKIKFGDGVKEAVGLSDSQAAAIVNNTFVLKNGGDTIADNATAKISHEYNAGITTDGIPFKYTIEDGVITSFEQITDSKELANVVNGLGGVYKTSTEFIEHIGENFSHAINRTLDYYKNDIPPLPTGATFKGASQAGVYGWIPTPGALDNQGEYQFKVENGHIVAAEYPLYLESNSFKKGNEAKLLDERRIQAASGAKPKNSQSLEATPIHENGHNTMARLSILELNRKIDEGILKVDGMDVVELNKTIRQQWEDLHELLAKNALESMGLQFSEAEWKRQALTISGYAGSGSYANKTYHYETFSEAALDYYANGANASKFSIAIVEQMKKMSERFGVAADPGVVFAKNGLEVKGLFKDDQYNFPAKAKTDAQKAKWLDTWRQDNPYLKGKGLFTEDSYRKANLWDTYFQKEIRAYNPNSKSTMPDLLAKKNGDFLEDLSSNAAKMMVQRIKEASVEGFDENLATMVLSRNSKDVVEAMDNFIIGRVNQSADEIAAKMPGGKTPENVNKARATVWSEDSIRNDIINTVATLSPDIDMGNIQSKVNNLFKTQAEGYASFEALPVETKKAVIEAENLSAKLAKENNYAKKIGKEVDSKARQEYLGEVTQVISYKQNGEDVYVVVSDPVVASVLKNPNNYKETSMTVETLAQMSNFLSRTYRIGTTGVSPLALVRNVLRDPMQAAIQGGFNPLTMNLSPQVFYRTLRGYGLDDVTIETVTRRLADWSGSSTLTAEMRKMGAISPNSISYNSRAGKINRVLDKATSNKIIEAAEAPLESWESFFRNQIAQQSFAKNYQRTKNVDKAMAAAMFDASNSTTNFSHSVGLFKRATSTVPYLSSAINGTRSFWTQFNVDPIGMITRVTAGFMMPAMAITAWNLSSEERRKEYMNLPEWYRDSHLVLLDLEGNIISFPIPDELSQYYGTARRLIEYTQDATPYGLSSIMAQGVFGFLPVDVDGFFGEDNTIHWEEGISQAGSTLMPQAATAIYEFIAEKDLYTGQDLSTYDGLNKTINTLSNLFGSGIKNAANDIGMMMGVSDKIKVGKSTADTLARDLFGVGFDNAKNQFMALVGSPSTIDANGKETKATGLFAENEKLKKQIETKDKEIAYASADRVKELEEEKRNLIQNFTDKVVNLTNKYMSLYTQTGGLEEWQKEKLVKLLTLGEAYSSADSTSYQYADISEANLDERSLAQQRYVDAGLPAGPSLASLGQRDTGTFINSIETQAAINRFYGAPKQASTDFDRAVKNAGLKNIRDEFYDAVSKVYDTAEANNETPDYDMIEKIQARYLQAVDSALVPIINQYGISILNNSSFIDTVEKYVNGMIPSDDWKQSTKNAKKYLSTKEFPTATVNVKKWLIQRYSSGMKDRGLASDSEVTNTLNAIKEDIDSGRKGAARGKIESLMKGINRANYYISSNDFQTLSNYYNMVK